MADNEVQEKVEQWRNLAEQFINAEDVYLTSDWQKTLIEESQGKTDGTLRPNEYPSGMRKRLAYGVAYHLQKDMATDSNKLQKELELWENVGKVVIRHLLQYPPGYCRDGVEALTAAKRLLGMKMRTSITVVAFTSEPTVIEHPLRMMLNNEQLRVTITDTEGNILVSGLVIDEFYMENIE